MVVHRQAAYLIRVPALGPDIDDIALPDRFMKLPLVWAPGVCVTGIHPRKHLRLTDRRIDDAASH